MDGGSNRRAFPRVKATEVQGLSAARLTSGADITLIDLSRSGAQFETDRRFLPNAAVSLRLVTTDAAFVVNGRVVRSRIVRLADGKLGYNIAVAFNATLQYAVESAAAAEPPAPEPRRAEPEPPPQPAVEPPRWPAESSAPQAAIETAQISERAADISPEEGEAFEAIALQAPSVMTLTATLDSSSTELLDLFNGNDW